MMSKNARIRQSIQHTELNMLSGTKGESRTPLYNLDFDILAGKFYVDDYVWTFSSSSISAGTDVVITPDDMTGFNVGINVTLYDDTFTVTEVSTIVATTDTTFTLGSVANTYTGGEGNNFIYANGLFRGILQRLQVEDTTIVSIPDPVEYVILSMKNLSNLTLYSYVNAIRWAWSNRDSIMYYVVDTPQQLPQFFYNPIVSDEPNIQPPGVTGGGGDDFDATNKIVVDSTPSYAEISMPDTGLYYVFASALVRYKGTSGYLYWALVPSDTLTGGGTNRLADFTGPFGGVLPSTVTADFPITLAGIGYVSGVYDATRTLCLVAYVQTGASFSIKHLVDLSQVQLGYIRLGD